MKLNIEYFDSTEELLLNGNSPNVCDLNNLNNLNLLVRADTSDISDTATDGRGTANNDELLIYQFQRDFFFEKSQELQELKETAGEAEAAEAADIEEQPQQLQPLQPLRELCALHGRGAVILINDNRHTAYVEETDDVANSLASIIGSDEDAYEDEDAEAEQVNPSNYEEAANNANDAEKIGSDTGNTGDTVNTVATVGTADPADNSADPAETADAAETANTSDTVGSVSSNDSDGSDGDEAEEAANAEDTEDAEKAANDEDMYEVPTISTFYWNTAIIIVTTSSASSAAVSDAPTVSTASVHITRYLVKKIREISGYRVTHREEQTANNCEINCGEFNCGEFNCGINCENLDNLSDNLPALTAFFILKNVLQTQIVRVVRVISGEDQQNSPIPSIPTSRFFIINQAKGVYATARLLSEKRILVLSGSRISKEDSLVHQKGQEASERLRQGLIEAGVIDKIERTFITDYEFHSTSSAASVILGQSANGLTTWKDGAGHKLNKLLGRRN